MIGFRATDDGDACMDTPDAVVVVDGHSSEREPTLAEQGAVFVAMAKELRELGCVEVRAGDFRAVWPAHAVSPVKLQAEAVLRAAKQKPKEEPMPEKVLDTDTPDDAHRRADYIRIQKAIGGGT